MYLCEGRVLHVRVISDISARDMLRCCIGLFQLQMRISFLFILAKDLHRFLIDCENS